jgi:hypothetical protein
MLRVLHSAKPRLKAMVCMQRTLMDVGPKYFPDPSEHDFRIPELDHSSLQSISRSWFDVEYLSTVNDYPSFPVHGYVYGRNSRLLVNLCCQPDKYGSDPKATPWVNVLFVFNTLSPLTYLSKNARAQLGCHHQLLLPVRMHSCLALDTHLSPEDSHFPELNILGLDFMKRLKLKFVLGWRIEFEISSAG